MSKVLLCAILAAASAAAEPTLSNANLPIVFESNTGQASTEFRYLSRAAGQTMLLAPDHAVISVAQPSQDAHGEQRQKPREFTTHAIAMRFEGANPSAPMQGGDAFDSRTFYYQGSSTARTAAHFASVRAASVYRGIDIVYHGKQGKLEHDFVVAPGADPSLIRVRFEGVEKIRIDEAGNLVLQAGEFEVIEQKPVLYQGTETVDGAYKLLADGAVGFEIGAYDRSRELVIDPIIFTKAGYLGGSGADYLQAIETLSNGDIVAVGYTESTNFPGTPLVRNGPPPPADVWVVRIKKDLGSLIWAAVLGGSGAEDAYALEVNAFDEIFVSGFTSSTNYPTMNPFQPALSGGSDIFVLGLPQTGDRLLFSSYYGGTAFESSYGAASDPDGNHYFCGYTSSTNLNIPANGFQRTFGGVIDAVAGSVSRTGQLRGATYLGHTGQDFCQSMAFRNGHVYLAGDTTSANLPFTPQNRLQQAIRGSNDVFIAQFNPTFTQLVYLTPIGGMRSDNAFNIYVNPMLQILVVGMTQSRDFPAATDYPISHNGGPNGTDSDAFAIIIDTHPAVTQLWSIRQSILLGGTGNDLARAAVPWKSAGKAFFGFTLLGGSQSTYASKLTNLRDCAPPPSGFNLAIWQGLFGQQQQDAVGGCLTPGVFFDAATSRGQSFLGAIVDVAVPGISVVNSFDGTHNGNVDGAVIQTELQPSNFFNIGQMSHELKFGAGYRNSSDGTVTLDTWGLTETIDQGYFNLFIPDVGWVGQNLPFSKYNGIRHPEIPIILRNNTQSQVQTRVNVKVSIDPEPIANFDTSKPTLTVPVSPRLENAECLATTPTVPPPPMKDRSFTASGETWEHVLRRSDINIQAATNQCSTVGLANSLQYLESQHSTFVIPHEHTKGLKGDNSLVGQLDTAANRTAPSRTSGQGLNEQEFLAGKFKYLSDNNLASKLEHKFQGKLYAAGGASFTTSDYSANGSTAKSEGAKPTFDWICDQIKQGEDVELVYSWTGGAHVVRVFGCGKVRGAPYLWTLDDGVQTVNDPEDAMGTRTQRIFVSEFGTADLHWDNVNFTIDNAIAESFTTAVKQTPGGNPITWREALTNGASFVANSFTKGSIGTAFGYFASLVSNPDAPGRAALQPKISDTEVLLDGVALPLYFVSPGQINFQIPTDKPLGQATLQVRQGNRTSAATTIDVAAAAPGVLEFRLGAARRGVIQNQDFTLHTPDNGIKAGQFIIVYMTGLGEKDTLVPTGQESPSALVQAKAQVTATIGGQPAQVLFAGLTPGFVGLEQANIVVPNLAPGEYPLVITVAGVASVPVPINVVP